MPAPRLRRLLLLCLWPLVTAAWLLPASGDEDYVDRLKPGRCRCDEGKSTWEYLRSPMTAPEDPPHCGLMRNGGNCAKRPPPKGHRVACWNSKKKSCFWKRHAWSWGITCSACYADTECEACGPPVFEPDPKLRTWLEQRLAAEGKTLEGKLVVARSKHFYLVTNLHKKLKVVTKRGTKRLMSAHEVAHLYLQRCEQAYDDFVHWFGGPIVGDKPTAVFVVDTKRENDMIGERYFGKAGIHMNYAFAYNNRICEGLCGNGFVVNAAEQNTDRHMHGFSRHQVGHILFSCWHLTNGFEDHCPRWAWCGAAHFLQKLPQPLMEGYATYCYGEAEGGTGPINRWPKRVLAMAKKRMEPIETFFGRNSLSSMRYEDHLRSWSVMDLMLREDRDRWLKLLLVLRNGGEESVAFKEGLGLAPEAFHERWVERVVGDRETMGPERSDDPTEPDSVRSVRRQLEGTDKVDILAGRIRGLDVVRDARLVPLLLPYLQHESDLVRESLQLVLARTEDEDVKQALLEEGLDDRRAIVRAETARVLAALRYEAARFPLEKRLKDRHWLVRANAAFALQRIGNRIARRALQAALPERDARAWIAICDAFAWFGGRSKDATALIAPRLTHRLWQVRLTAARSLRRVGTADALDALIERFREEQGRLRAELHGALVGVAGHDAGHKPDDWSKWWRVQQEKHGGLPPKPKEPEAPHDDDRYAPPPPPPDEDAPRHYGRRFFSRAVCFVLDTSGSTELNMKVPAAAAKKLRIPISGTRLYIGKAQLIGTLKRLDPRTRVRLVFFDSKVYLWKHAMIPASGGNVAQAVRAVERQRPRGETNFHGALKAALGHHKLATIEPQLDPIPDTVFFITDGRPTRGEITSMPELTSWMANLNRFAKVRLHVIALGELNVDLPSLAKLAAAGEGDLIHVPEE